MITLEDLIKKQKYSGMSDMQVIRTLFEMNDLEEEGMGLITKLSKSAIEKLKCKERMVKEWFSKLPSMYLYENYDLEIADSLHNLELDFISNGGELSDGRFEWAKENLSKINRPKIYFNPLVEWLNAKGINFKEEIQ